MSETSKNLKEAFSGARAPSITKLFRAAAYAETVHALNHLDIMGEIRSTLENLETAISGETFEFDKMYPEFIEIAKGESDNKVIWSFNVANQVEKIHANSFCKTLESRARTCLRRA
jgi:rubrerythrin